MELYEEVGSVRERMMGWVQWGERRGDDEGGVEKKGGFQKEGWNEEGWLD